MRPLTAKQHEALVALEQNDGSLSKAARSLGVSENALIHRIGRIERKVFFDPLNNYDRRKYLQEVQKAKETCEKKSKKEPFIRCARKCIYRAPDGAPWGCEYALITGVSRGCQPGKNCERFKPSTRK